MVERLKYSHDAMADLITAEPTVTNKELAEIFGYSEGWVGQVVRSDSFQARLAERRERLVDPVIRRSVEDRLRHVTAKALDVLEARLDSPDASAATALEALGVATTALRG